MDLYSFFNCPWNERQAAIDEIIKDMGDVVEQRKSAAE